jgi:hypothetical protein
VVTTSRAQIVRQLFLSLGLIGACIIIDGLTQVNPQLHYVIGAFCMLGTAIYFRLTYFIALEMILIAGHGAVLLGIGSTLQLVLPILLTLQLLMYYLLIGELNNFYRVIGIIGIALLSIGFSYAHQWVFFLGSSAIAFYAFYQAYKGEAIALLWAVLNVIFVITSLYYII